MPVEHPPFATLNPARHAQTLSVLARGSAPASRPQSGGLTAAAGCAGWLPWPSAGLPHFPTAGHRDRLEEIGVASYIEAWKRDFAMPSVDFSHLSPQERIDLIGDICDSLDGEALPLSAEWKAELDRRNANFADDRAHAIPWRDVRAKLRPGHS